jgi:23S rRNA (pseudouridine1915-N3)-methyltransferase
MPTGGSRLAFVIGGAEGLPASIKGSRQYEFWSLSKLTFTHQWARVLLTEQLYRATEIRKGSGYHKE